MSQPIPPSLGAGYFDCARRDLDPAHPQKVIGNPCAMDPPPGAFEQQLAGQYRVIDDGLRLLDDPQVQHQLQVYPG
jgi:hypothetical protein